MQRKTLLLLVCVAVALASTNAMAVRRQLLEGDKLQVKIYSPSRVNSGECQKNDTIRILLLEDIVKGKETVVEKGAVGMGIVNNVVKASRPGKPGEISISFLELKPKGRFKPEGGGIIKLAGTFDNKGGGRKVLSWLFIFGLFIKGGQGEIDTSQSHEATVAETIMLAD